MEKSNIKNKTETQTSVTEDLSLYVTQIRYLEEQLDSCQREQEWRENKYKEVVSQFAAMQEDKKVQTRQMKLALSAKENRVNELLDLLEKNSQDAIYYRDTLTLENSNELQEMHELMDSLDSEHDEQVERFEEQRKALIHVKWRLAALGSLRMQMKIRQKEHTAAINIMIKEELLERDRKIQALQSSVDTTVMLETAKALKKNEAQHRKQLQQLDFLETAAGLLQEDTDAERVREREVCAKEHELKKDFMKVIHQKSTHMKEVEELSQKREQLMVELKDCRLSNQRLLAQTEALSRRLSLVHAECHQTSTEIAALQAKLHREERRRRRLEGVEQEAAIILRHIMPDSEKPSEARWKILRLLEILESTAPQEARPASVRPPEDRGLRRPATRPSAAQ